MPIGSGFGGGRDLGTARGSIVIDTSSVEKSAVSVKAVGQDISKSMQVTTKYIKDYEKAINDAISKGKFVEFIRQIKPLAQETKNLSEQMKQTGAAGKTAAQQIEEAFRRAGSGVRSFSSGIQSFSQQIKSLRNEIAAVGIAGAVLSKIGLDGAKNVRNYRVSFKTLLGDEQKATELMRQLTNRANEFGIEMEEVWQLGRALLPSLNGNVDALDEFVKRAALLASTNPLKSTADAARAIQEYLAGQTISIQRLFNIDPNLIQEAQDRFKDVGDQLDYILGRMGATEEGARQMADAWVGVKNELRLLLAEGFTPLLETLRPILTQFREWVSELRQSNPEIAKVGAGIAAIAAVGAPTLLFLGKMVETIVKIKKTIDGMNAAKLATLGNLAKGGLAVAGGVGLGIAVTQGIGRATGNEQLANADLAMLWQQIRQILFTIVAGLSEVFKQIANLFLNSAEGFNRALVNMINGMAGFVRFIGNVLPAELGGDRLKGIADNLDNFAQTLLETSQERIKDARTRLDEGQQNFLKGALDFLGLSGSGAASAASAGGGGSVGGDTGVQDRVDAMREYNEQLKQIEIDRLKQVADATEQYTEQRADAIEQYERQAAREEEDFLRQRRRQEEQYQRDVERINQERYEREAEWAADLAERINELRTSTDDRIAEIREEGNDRLAQIEEDYQKDRERREREHRLSLLSAAARLDASAVAEEQRRFKEANKTAEEEYQDRIKEEQDQLEERLENERKNLEERIKQEQEANQKRIDEARKADEKRIADMRQSLNEQQRIEDEDRKIRLDRAKEDHLLQLQELEDAHQKRLMQIAEQAAEERKLLREQFEEKMDLLREQHQQEVNQSYAGAVNGGTATTGGGGSIGGAGYAQGGAVYGTGLAMLHGSRSRPEYVLDGATTAALRSVLGNFNQASLLGAVAGNGRSMTVNMAGGAIQIHAAPGQSAGDIGTQVEAAMYRFFNSVGAG